MKDRLLRPLVVALLALLALAPRAWADEFFCDASYQNCRNPLVQLIQQENVGLDVAFWFMEDSRLSTEIIRRWQAGVPVRVIIDQRAFPSLGGDHPVDYDIVQQLVAAGIPIRQRSLKNPDILHWKTMIFVGQNTVEFSGANYSPTAFVPQTPYVDFEDEAIYFSDKPSIVQSFMTKYDDLWTDNTNYANYANITGTPARNYPTYTKDPELNFPQQESYATRLLGKYSKETQGIDVIMFRITDERETNAVIATMQRGIPVRLITDLDEYRVPSRQWVSYNLDKLYAAGLRFRVRAHAGLNHQKLVQFYSQGLSVFGSSNWTTPSDNHQQEHNMFAGEPWIFDYFQQMFERKWCSGPFAAGVPGECAGKQNPAGSAETTDFVPLPPDKPVLSSPSSGATGIATSGVKLKWNGGYYAHYYDIYFGIDPNPPLWQANAYLGPYDYKTHASQSVVLPTLQPGTTYYWKIVSRTMAGMQAKPSLIYSFTTAGTPPTPPPPPAGATTQVIWASDVQPASIVGRWAPVADVTAVNGIALWNQDKSNARISPALAAPASYFEVPFTAVAGVPYHVWIRMRAQANSTNNDSVSAQFNDSVDPFGSATYRIGTATGMEFVLQDGASGTLAGWGWADSGFGAFGPDVYFTTSGTHTLRIQQRTDGTLLDQIVISPDTYIRTSPGTTFDDGTWLGSTISAGGAPSRPSVPSPWAGRDIGVEAINGQAGYTSGTGLFTVVGGGGDAWGSADGMYFAYQPLSGDGSIVARITGISKAMQWSRAGIMIRETFAATSANAFMYLTPNKVSAFQWRPAEGQQTFATLKAVTSVAPIWVRLDRAGNTFTAYQSSDGVNWSYVDAETIPMAASVYAGLGVTSATIQTYATGTFDRVTVTAGTPTPPVAPPAPPYLPGGWAHQDVGAVGFTGTASFDTTAAAFTMKGAGKDVWGTADAMQFAYRPMTGDGAIVARLAKLSGPSSSTKAGVMIRSSLDPAAANAFMLVTPLKGTAFQQRASDGASSTSTAGTLDKAPVWVKLQRTGNTIAAYQSLDGATWTLVGSGAFTMGSTVYVGLAVSSHDQMNLATAVFDNVTTP